MARLFFVLGLFMIISVSDAQIKGLSQFDMEGIIEKDALERLNAEQLSQTISLPFGNIVEDEYYMVGPGDILVIQNLSSPTQKEIVNVTPENKLFVPRIGEIDLNGKTLAETKELVIKEISGAKEDATAFVSLYKPRNVIVEIAGNVALPGTYTFPASYKISTLIRYANQKKSSNVLSMQQNSILVEKVEKDRQLEELFSNCGMPYYSSYSNRNVLVFHSDGASQVADFEKAIALNDSKYDPYIREGDRIYVPYDNQDFPLITIAGSVIRPFVTVFKKGDMASMLLKFGGGLKEDADLSDIRLIFPQSNKELELEVNEGCDLLSEDIELEPGSVIIVGKKKKATLNENGVVSVVGQVINPGVYPIKSDETTIKEVIELAGGFTDEAYLPLANIIRRDETSIDPKSNLFKIMEKFQFSNLSVYDTTRFKMDVIMRLPYVSCDFVDAFINNNESANIKLKDGDIIRVPTNPKTVFVYGQVRNPGYVSFVENKPMEWYIQKAGGYAQTAEQSKARIIRGRNKIWIEGDDNIAVYAGDEVYVPAPPSVPVEVESQKWTMYASMATTIVALLNAIYWWTQ
jgi:protein involved in polysaccharide export with SLBB domain